MQSFDAESPTKQESIEPSMVDQEKYGTNLQQLESAQPNMEFRAMQMDKTIAERSVRQKAKRRKEQENIDDWFAGDYSCCLMVPIEVGVNAIGVFTVVDGALLLR